MRTRIVLLCALIAASCGGTVAETGSSPGALASVETAPPSTESVELYDTIRVAALGVVDTSPIWIADSQGYFAEEGVEIEIVPVSESDDVIGALIDGSADAIATTPIKVLEAANSGEDVRITNYLNATSPDATRHSMTLVTTFDSGIESICDLPGSLIGIDDFDSLAFVAVLQAMTNADCSDAPDTSALVDTEPSVDSSDTESAADSDAEAIEEPAAEEYVTGIDVSSVEFVDGSLSSQLDSLEAGDVDVVALFEPYTARAKRRGFVEVLNLDQELCPGLNRCPVGLVVTTDDFADDNADLNRRFNVAINRAMLWMESNEIEYRAELIQCCGITPEDAADIRVADWVGNVAAIDKDLGRLMDVLRLQGLMPFQPNMRDLVS